MSSDGEKQGVRENIDRMTKHLVEHDPALARDPERARRIARDAALRVEHGVQRHTEGRRRG